MDARQEVAPGLVVAGGDGAVLLALAAEVLDQVPRGVAIAVVVARRLASSLWGDDHLGVGLA
jgi:hypothetical protein